MRKPPVNPEDFDKVNYVIDAWSRPCVAPWYIYVETLKPALLAAFITLITFGWDDVARGYARPKGLGRRTGKGKGKRRGARPLRFPELGEALGRNLPGSDSVKGIKWSDTLKTLWRIDTAAQMAMWWWLVASVTEDFAFDWTSVLYQTRWCQDADLGRFSFQTWDDLPMPGNTWWTAHFDREDYHDPMPSWTITHGNTGPNGASIAFALNFEQWPGQPAWTSVQSRLVDRDSLEVFAETGPKDPDADGKATALISTTLGGARKFKVQVRSDPGPAHYGGGVITGMEDRPQT